MNISLDIPLVDKVSFTDVEFILHLKDARKLSVPLAWFPHLSHATKEQLHSYCILGDGEGIHWEVLDEDISVAGLLFGNASKSVA